MVWPVSMVLRVLAKENSPPCLHDHVTGNLEHDVKSEENGQTCLVLVRLEAEICRKPEEVGISDVGSIQERKQV